MLVKSTLFLLSSFLLDDPVHQAPKFRSSEVVVQEIRKLLEEIETESQLISRGNLAIAAGLVNSDLPVSDSALGEFCTGLIWSGRNEELLNVLQRDSLNFEDRKTLTFHVVLALTMNKQFELLDRVVQRSEFKDSVLNFAYKEAYQRGDDQTCEWIQSKITFNFDDDGLGRLSRIRSQHKNRLLLLGIIGFQFHNADLGPYEALLDKALDEANPKHSQRELLSAIQQRWTVSNELLEQIKMEDESSPILLKYRLIHEGISVLQKEFPQLETNQSYREDLFRKKVINWFCVEIEGDYYSAAKKLSKMADWLQEWEQSTENLAKIDRKIRLERSVRRSAFTAMQSCLAFWARQNCDGTELVELSRVFSYPEHQLNFLIAAISDYP